MTKIEKEKKHITPDFKRRLDEYVLFNMQNWLAQEQENRDESIEVEVSVTIKAPKKVGAALEAALSEQHKTFQEQLFEIIDEKGLRDTEVYKRAHIDRKLFSRIRCKRDYKPKKDTALALAMALELTIDETEELLRLAELALSPGVRFDLIVKFCIMNGVYDVDEVNDILDKYGEHIIGE